MTIISWVNARTARIRAWLAGLRKLVDLNDAHAYGGLAMLGYGLQQLWPGVGWVICGAALFWLGVRK
jgi:hypothetical protein